MAYRVARSIQDNMKQVFAFGSEHDLGFFGVTGNVALYR